MSCNMTQCQSWYLGGRCVVVGTRRPAAGNISSIHIISLSIIIIIIIRRCCVRILSIKTAETLTVSQTHTVHTARRRKKKEICAVVSLGWVSPVAATEGVTPIYFLLKTDDLLFFAQHSGVTPPPWRVSPHTFLPVCPCLFTILCKFGHKFFSFRCHPLEGVTRGGPPPPVHPQWRHWICVFSCPQDMRLPKNT